MKEVANGWTRTYEEMKLEIAMLREMNEALEKANNVLRTRLSWLCPCPATSSQKTIVTRLR